MREGRVIAIVQARMRSTRLPGKVLKEIAGEPMISYLVKRLKRSRYIDDLVIATSVEHADDAISNYCRQNGVCFFRGSEIDVLSRYFYAAKASKADFVVRVCADSPLIDPEMVDELILEFLQSDPECDYLSNTLNQSCPLGMNTEVFTLQALEQANTNAVHPYDREHVTPYLYRHPEIFLILEKHYKPDMSNIRLTVDTPEDLELISLILQKFPHEKSDFGLPEILQFLEANPQALKINSHIQQTVPVASNV